MDPTAAAAEMPESGSPARETVVAAIGVARKAMIMNKVEERGAIAVSFLRTRDIYRIEVHRLPTCACYCREELEFSPV